MHETGKVKSKTEMYMPHITPCPNRLRSKIALITGGGKGIGRAIALRFASEGADIVIADLCEDSSNATVREIVAMGAKAIFLKTDVASRANVESTVSAAVQHFGGIDILVNNAGIIVFGSILDCELTDWNRMLDVDLTGALHFVQLVGRHMKEQERPGRLIHIGSTASLLPTAQQGAYCVAKAGLRMVSMMAAMELGPYGITSNLICPEGAVTDMNRDLLRNPEVMQKLESRITAGRLSTTEEVAALVAFLASDEAAYINGADMIHDGGTMISPLWWR